MTLKRLNAFSNNDIERLGASLGGGEELAAFVRSHLGSDSARIRFETLSGLGTNRMTCRDITRLLRELRTECDAAGLAVSDLLPAMGCDPGTLEQFSRLGAHELRAAVVAKTGSLTETDGGVAILAGFARVADGESVFCVASPSESN